MTLCTLLSVAALGFIKSFFFVWFILRPTVSIVSLLNGRKLQFIIHRVVCLKPTYRTCRYHWRNFMFISIKVEHSDWFKTGSSKFFKKVKRAQLWPVQGSLTTLSIHLRRRFPTRTIKVSQFICLIRVYVLFTIQSSFNPRFTYSTSLISLHSKRPCKQNSFLSEFLQKAVILVLFYFEA